MDAHENLCRIMYTHDGRKIAKAKQSKSVLSTNALESVLSTNALEMVPNFQSVLSTTARAKINDLVAQYKRNKDGVCSIHADIDKILKSEGAATRESKFPKQVAVHPANRNGQMITASGYQNRGLKMHGVGFVKSVLEREAVAFHDNPFTQKIAHESLKLFQTDPRFASYNLNEIQGGSVGASHANHWCAATIDEQPCNLESVSAHGKIDKNRLYTKDEFRDVCEGTGAKWWWIRWEIDYEFPEIPDIYQGALNAVQHVGSGDSRDGWMHQNQYEL